MALCRNKEGKQLRVVAPDYVYHYPCFKRVQLAAVKHGIMNPNLPTLRHMERDDVMCKLSDEHCRNTTTCTARDFAGAAMNTLQIPSKRLYGLNITETGKKLNRRFLTARDIQEAKDEWARFLASHRPPRPTVQEEINKALFGKADLSLENLHFDGVAVRFVKPEIRDWRYKFKCEPRLDKYGQTATPSEIVSRHRHAQPLYFRDMSGCHWTPPTRGAGIPPCPYY